MGTNISEARLIEMVSGVMGECKTTGGSHWEVLSKQCLKSCEQGKAFQSPATPLSVTPVPNHQTNWLPEAGRSHDLDFCFF